MGEGNYIYIMALYCDTGATLHLMEPNKKLIFIIIGKVMKVANNAFNN